MPNKYCVSPLNADVNTAELYSAHQLNHPLCKNINPTIIVIVGGQGKGGTSCVCLLAGAD